MDRVAWGHLKLLYSASVSFNGGTATLKSSLIEIAGCNASYSISLSFSIDLNNFVHVCLPQVCVPVLGCTPGICIDFPTVTIPITFGDTVTFTADLTPNAQQSSSGWAIEIVIVNVPSLDFGAATAAFLFALQQVLSATLGGIPFIGGVLADGITAILAAIGVAGITGLLGLIITPFVAGRHFTIHNLPTRFAVLAADGGSIPRLTS